ncbi:MAG: M20/M25/M40 family metallo-hydrolase [Caldilineaceae bacterium]|nr:M20/M25/M40 family metallo-hydrolase [Caldilineaceae bacterium]
MQRPDQQPDIAKVAAAFRMQRKQLLDLCIQVQQIPAPTGQEQGRAAWVEEAFRARGLQDVSRDEEQNVYGRIPGRQSGPALMVSAHTDTVFPLETDLSIRVDNQAERVYGPGLGDNSTGVAGLLALARVLARYTPPTDVWLVANSGEEGLGDLRGMRAAVDRLQNNLGAAIVIEGMGLGRIVHRALGSRRYRISATAPGGHSWSDFGEASAIHGLTRLAADLTRLDAPETPRTTFNIGRIAGGTSINTIAQTAWLELDMRSETPAGLAAIDAQVQAIMQRYQTGAAKNADIEFSIETIGDRPSGEIGAEHPLVIGAVNALAQAGLTGIPELSISSTDANIPLSRGIPAVCVGITEGGNAHRLEEWITPRLLPRGMQHLLLLTWQAAEWLTGQAAPRGAGT